MGQKRELPDDLFNEKDLEEKKQRTNLASVVMEAIKVNSMKKFWQVLEPVLRRVVNEEVERALTKFVPSNMGLKQAQQLQSYGPRKLRLQFQNKLALPLFTGSRVQGRQGNAIHIVLEDAITREVVTSGEGASARLDVVVLEGDFLAADDEDWTLEEFENHEVREREGKRPLLTGELAVCLKDGTGMIGELFFTDNSSWIRSRKFRLGVKLSPGFCEGTRIREAKTEAFSVKDHRGELYKKHYPPTLNDEVWRLEKIGKDGAYHKRLNRENIFTVEHFLRAHFIEPQKLRDIFGSNMSNKTWEAIIDHAKTCVLNEKHHVFYPQDSQNIGVIFNTIYQPMGVVVNGHYVPLDSLSETEKVHVDRLTQVAYRHLDSIIDYNGDVTSSTGPADLKVANSHRDSTGIEAFQRFRSHTNSVQRGAGVATTSNSVCIQDSEQTYSGTHALPACDPSLQVAVTCKNQTQQPEHRNLQEMTDVLFNSDPASQLPSASCTQNSIQNNPLLSVLAHGGPQYTLPSQSYLCSSGFLDRAMIYNGYYRPKDLMQSSQEDFCHNENTELSSEECSLRTDFDGVLDTDDIQLQVQQLLHVFSADSDQNSGSSNSTLHDDEVFPHVKLQSSPDLGRVDGRIRTKAYKGWAKLKAALVWGAFYKQRAAARKARIEELED
eukprot:c24847_g1_i1 orf=777-2768(+)